VPGAVGHIDLMPSILDMAGVDAPPGMDGKSWLPLARSEADSMHEALLLTGGALKQHGRWVSPELAIRTDTHKYICRGTAVYHEGQTRMDITCLCAPPWRGQADRPLSDMVEHFNALPRRELYDLADDPHETTNIAAREPAVAAALDERLRAYVARGAERLLCD
jgi:arylsulfatase A-like enzyme